MNGDNCIGHCFYCGQAFLMEKDMNTQHDADKVATMMCSCDEGRPHRREERECEIISTMFPEFPEITIDLLIRIADMIRNEHIFSGTNIKVSQSVSARFKLKDGVVQITRRENKEHQRSI